MFYKLASLTLATLVPLAAHAVPQACPAATEADVHALFERWNTALQSGDPQAVVDLYESDAVLLPTASNQPRLDAAQRLDYFQYFMSKGPAGQIDTSKVLLDCNQAIDTGTYTFTFSDGSKVPARYTFSYRWKGDQWLISSHHSSAMPEQQ